MSPYKVPTYNGLRLDVKADPQTGYFQAKLSPFNKRKTESLSDPVFLNC
ncbi:hypothetical protein [Photorhabdus asymbiotica]